MDQDGFEVRKWSVNHTREILIVLLNWGCNDRTMDMQFVKIWIFITNKGENMAVFQTITNGCWCARSMISEKCLFRFYGCFVIDSVVCHKVESMIEI